MNAQAHVTAIQMQKAKHPSWLVEEPERAGDLAAVVAMLPDVIFKCERRNDGKIYWLMNEGKLAVEFGLTTDTVRGKCITELFPPPVVKNIEPHFQRCFDGDAHEFINELGGRYFNHYPQPIVDPDGCIRTVVGFISEVTSLVKAEEEIRRLNEELSGRVRELEVANRQLEAYSYSVSHDLRGPLAAMSANTELLKRQLGTVAQPAQESLNRLARSTRRMDQLIDDILSIAKASRGEMPRQEVNLSVFAHEAVADLQERFPEHKVELLIEPELRVVGNPRLLRVVVENLLSNAWKYTARVPHAVVKLYRSGDGSFTVKDNGAGLDMNRAGKLFQAFERLHEDSDFQGTGVGLHTVRRIVLAHGGDIHVNSAPGEGAAFTFTIVG